MKEVHPCVAQPLLLYGMGKVAQWQPHKNISKGDFEKVADSHFITSFLSNYTATATNRNTSINCKNYSSRSCANFNIESKFQNWTISNMSQSDKILSPVKAHRLCNCRELIIAALMLKLTLFLIEKLPQKATILHTRRLQRKNFKNFWTLRCPRNWSRFRVSVLLMLHYSNLHPTPTNLKRTRFSLLFSSLGNFLLWKRQAWPQSTIVIDSIIGFNPKTSKAIVRVSCRQ